MIWNRSELRVLWPILCQYLSVPVHAVGFLERGLRHSVQKLRPTNPPAPKVPRCGSLAARDTNGQICQYSFSWGGTCCNIGSNWGQFRPTWIHLAPTSAHLGSNMPQFGTKLGPFGGNFGPSWGPHGFNIGDMADPIWNLKHTHFHLFFPRLFWASMMLRVEQCSPCCVCVGPTLARSCHKSVPSCATLDACASHGFSPTSAPPDRSLGPQLKELGPFGGSPGPSWAQPAPFSTQCERWKLAFLLLFLTVFGFGGSCKAMLPTLVLSCAQIPRQMPPHRTKLRMLSPTSQVGPKHAPVRPNLRPRTAKFGPSRLWLGQVRPLLSSLSSSLGAGGSPREATRIPWDTLSLCHEFVGGRERERREWEREGEGESVPYPKSRSIAQWPPNRQILAAAISTAICSSWILLAAPSDSALSCWDAQKK